MVLPVEGPEPGVVDIGRRGGVALGVPLLPGVGMRLRPPAVDNVQYSVTQSCIVHTCCDYPVRARMREAGVVFFV